VDPGLIAAEFGEPLQIRDNALSIDGRHVCASFLTRALTNMLPSPPRKRASRTRRAWRPRFPLSRE
jgi:hypothetical protein